MTTLFKFTVAGMMAISLACAGCNGGGGGTSAGGATPEKAFEAFKTAAANDDMKTFMNCMSAKSQNEFTFGMVMGTAFLPLKYMGDESKAEELGKEIESVMTKHGLSEDSMSEGDPSAEPDLEKAFAPVKDKAAFVADLFAIMKREDPDTPLKMLAGASLKDVKIDGDKAAGTLAVDGKDEKIEFVKSGGSWLIEMPSPEGPDLGGPEN